MDSQTYLSDSGSSIDFAETPTTEEVREKLHNRVFSSLQTEEDTVFKSPTSSGKTHLVATTKWLNRPEFTGYQPVVHISPTKDSRDETYEKNKRSEATGHRLRGREDACPLAGGRCDGIDAPDGTNPPDWFKKMCEGRGLPFSVAHGIFEREHDGDLPCSPCDSVRQWEGIPRDNDGTPSKDVVFATHSFARAPSLLEGCNVFIDEIPDFTVEHDVADFRRPVTSCLQHIDAPVSTWEDLITKDGQRDSNQFYRHKFDRPDREWYLRDGDAHILAPGIVRAVLSAEEQCHDRWMGETVYRFPDLNPQTNSPEYRVQIRIVFDEDYNIKLCQSLPDFSDTRCVIGLDAHPTTSKWRVNTLDSINFERILSEDEEQAWRRNERDLEIVQVGDNKHTWTKRGFNEQKVAGICSELRQQYGDEFTSGITSKRFETSLRSGMEGAGVDNPDTTYYGMEKSVGIFAGESVGLIAGCISPSSGQIKDWLALLGKEATPKREVRDEYQGQEWVGPDSSVAKELLADVREKHVLQAVGRYARSPADPEDRAIVYVLTNVLPRDWVDRRVNDVDVFAEKENEILTELASSRFGLTRKEITEGVSASKKHVCNTLDKCRGQSWFRVEEDAGAYSRDVFYADRSPNCIVEL